MVACAGYFIEQGLHFGGTVGVGGDAASVERHGVNGALEQAGERLPVFGNLGPRGILGLDQPHGDAFAGPAGDDALFGEVLPEEEVEDQTDYGCEEEHDDPRQGLQRVPVVGDDDQNDAEDRDRIERDEEVCQDLRHVLSILRTFRLTYVAYPAGPFAGSLRCSSVCAVFRSSGLGRRSGSSGVSGKGLPAFVTAFYFCVAASGNWIV